MVESLRAGHVDGFCVGEPWNGVAVAAGLGEIVATKSQLFPRSVEKVLAVRAPLEARLDQLGPLLRALAAARSGATSRRIGPSSRRGSLGPSTSARPSSSSRRRSAVWCSASRNRERTPTS